MTRGRRPSPRSIAKRLQAGAPDSAWKTDVRRSTTCAHIAEKSCFVIWGRETRADIAYVPCRSPESAHIARLIAAAPADLRRLLLEVDALRTDLSREQGWSRDQMTRLQHEYAFARTWIRHDPYCAMPAERYRVPCRTTCTCGLALAFFNLHRPVVRRKRHAN